jgi:hypothetical protein
MLTVASSQESNKVTKQQTVSNSHFALMIQQQQQQQQLTLNADCSVALAVCVSVSLTSVALSPSVDCCSMSRILFSLCSSLLRFTTRQYSRALHASRMTTRMHRKTHAGVRNTAAAQWQMQQQKVCQCFGDYWKEQTHEGTYTGAEYL